MTVEVEPSREVRRDGTGVVERGWVGALRRLSRLEIVVAAVVAVALVVLVVAEPDVLEAAFENTRTVVFTFGGAAVAAVALLAMLRLGVPPIARVLVIGVPFVAVTYWLVEPYFVDDKVDDEFVTSIEDASTPGEPGPAEPGPAPGQSSGTSTPTQPPPSAEPVLLGAGSFRGLAGHDGTGDAGIFALPEGGRVLRLESFDIENGPDLRLYIVPGADQSDPSDDALYLGHLRGNVGDQTYDLPPDFSLTPGPWTVLVWCEAFSVEFVAATVTVT